MPFKGADLARIRREAYLYRCLFVRGLQTMLEYKVGLLLGIVGGFGINALSLVFVSALFNKIPAIHGWSYWEIVLVYSLVVFAEGVNQLTCEGFSIMALQLYFGAADFWLVRPVSPMLQAGVGGFTPTGVGNTFFGAALGIFALVQLHPHWTLFRAAYAVVLVVSAVTIRIGLQTAVCSSSFWFRNSPANRFAISMNGLYNFVRYPISVYALAVQAIVVVAFPIAFVSFFPAVWILDKGHWAIGGLLTPVAALYSIALARLVFHRGLRRYESVGN